MNSQTVFVALNTYEVIGCSTCMHKYSYNFSRCIVVQVCTRKAVEMYITQSLK